MFSKAAGDERDREPGTGDRDASRAGARRRTLLPAVAFSGAFLLLLFAPVAIAVAAIGAAALAVCLLRRGYDADLCAPEKLLIFAGAFFVAVWLLAAWVHWRAPDPAAAAGFAALLLIYPFYRASRTVRLDEGGLWLACGAASVAIALAAAIHLAVVGPSVTVEPAWWPAIAFSLGAMSLAAVDYRGPRGAGFALLVAGTLGLMAALVAGAWGVWLALPFTVVVWFFHLPGRLSWRLRWGALLVIVIGLEAVLLVHGTGVLVRFRRLALQTNVWQYSHGTDGLFGAVLHDWSVALAAFADQPLIGVARGAHAADLNQYVLTLHGAGLIGALALVLLIGIPARAFARLAVHRDGAAQRIGRAGLLLVTIYGVIGLVQPPFAAARPLALYALAVAALYAVGRQRQAAARARPVARGQTLSVTVITHNEVDRLARCLDSVAGWADEIVVLDSGSTDATVELARRYTDRVEVTDWPGYGVQKQRALARARCAWVLSIDADEALTPELRHDIDAALGAAPACTGYRLPWAVVVYGRRLDFGRSSRAPLRLFKREGARFTAEVVHETVVPPPGKIGTLEGRLLHFTHRDFGHALEKSARYAWLGAERRFARGRHGGGLFVALLRSLWVFFQIYILRFGFLDGRPGFLVAVTYMQGAFNKYAGLWTLRRAAKRGK